MNAFNTSQKQKFISAFLKGSNANSTSYNGNNGNANNTNNAINASRFTQPKRLNKFEKEILSTANEMEQKRINGTLKTFGSIEELRLDLLR